MIDKFIKPNYLENDRPEFDKMHDEIYESLGRFLICFEDLLTSITDSIRTALRENGLSSITDPKKGEHLADIMLSEMEAMKLVNRYIAIFIIEFPEKEKEIRCMGTELRKLVETRNEIVHGKFFIHLGNEKGKDFLGYNYKTRSSLDKQVKKYDKWYFKRSFNDSTILQTYILLLRHVYIYGENSKFLHRITEENIKSKIPVVGCRIYDPEKFK